MTESVESLLKHLRASRDPHLKLGRYIMTAHGGTLYPLDFLAAAVLNRSLALIEGFCSMIETKNLIAAAPLLRLQLDNCIRFYAAWLVDDPHEFASKVLGGTPIRKQRDRDENLMTDRHLIQKLSADAPWIANVYEQTSGYIHLSEKHIYSTFGASESEGRINLKIGYPDTFTTDELYVEALEAFIEATRLLLKYAEGWGVTKDNPEIVARRREQQQQTPDTPSSS